MENKAQETKISDEIMAMVESRKTLYLASTDEEGIAYASYAPFAIGDECLYVLVSEIAIHGTNLQMHPNASVLIVEDEDTAAQIFARLRVQYRIKAELIPVETEAWQQGIELLVARQGEMITNLSQLGDFKLFKLHPQGGRYVKGFGQAFKIEGGSLSGESLSHLRDGHQKR